MIPQGEILSQIMNEQGVGVTELARLVKMSRTAVYNWLTMMRIPKDIVEKVSIALKVDVEHEMQVRSNQKPLKPYKKEGDQLAEPSVMYGMEKIAIGVFLDGSEELLNLSIKRLQAINANLQQV